METKEQLNIIKYQYSVPANVEENRIVYNLLAMNRMMKKTMAESPMMTAATGAE